MMNSQSQIGDYKIDYSTQLGQGQFGQVFPAYKISTQQSICVKQVINNLKNNQIMINEISIIEKLSGNFHENIVNVFEIIGDSSYLNIFMEKCNGDLKQLLDEQLKASEWFTLEQIVDFIQQIVFGYLHLRKLGIVHRDLKPENILYSKNINSITLKISDFGTSKAIEKSMCITKTGTPFYSAPETFSGDSYDDQCDVYSLGLIIYQLAYKNQKHAQLTTFQELKQFQENLQKTKFQCPTDPTVPPELKQLIQLMIVYDPKERIKWEDILSTGLFNRIKFVKNYLIDFGKTIGLLGKGQLRQCQHYFNKEIFVAKFLPESRELISQNGIRIYRDLQQSKLQNIQQIIEVIQCLNSEDYYVIMEKCDLNLFEYMKTKKFMPTDIKKFAKQIATGYLLLKQFNILHRDLKPENIVVILDQQQQPTYKVFTQFNQITGFETGRNLNMHDVAITNAGNQIYSAPEINGGRYTFSCDIFSLGILIYQLHYGQLPNNIQNQQQWIFFIQQLARNKFLCNRQGMDSDLCNLIEKMIVYDPQKRITWEDLQKSEHLQLIKMINSQQQMNRQQQTKIILIKRFCIYQYMEIIEEWSSQIYQEFSQFNYFQIVLPQNMYDFLLQTLSKLQYYLHHSLILIQQQRQLQIRDYMYTSTHNSMQQNKFNPEFWKQNFLKDSKKVNNNQYARQITIYQERKDQIENPNFLDYLDQLNDIIQHQKQAFKQFLLRNPSQNSINLLFRMIKLSNVHREYPILNVAEYKIEQFNLQIYQYDQKFKYIASSLQ